MIISFKGKMFIFSDVLKYEFKLITFTQQIINNDTVSN